MNGVIRREAEDEIKLRLRRNPAVAILGPRQCGKSTLAKLILQGFDKAVYLDLEKPSDLRKLDNPELFFEYYSDSLVCLDEIQQKPDLFKVLRAMIDENRVDSRFLLLGSASGSLLRQSSESLAGRISYLDLTPFYYPEISQKKNDFFLHLNRGGFPRSYLAENDEASLQWREDFIRTFLERDIPQYGLRIPSERLRRFWIMLAHCHGQIFNSAKISTSLGVSHNTVRTYLDLLVETFIVRILLPYEANVKKRLVKSPKVYLRDSGLLLALLDVEKNEELFSHPIFGAAWEGYIIENIISTFPDWHYSFYRTSAGAEVDLVMEKGMRKIAVECKVSKNPKVTKGFWNALEDVNPDQAWIIAPVGTPYPFAEGVMAGCLADFIEAISS